MNRKPLAFTLSALVIAASIPALGMARRLSANTIDPVATITTHGRQIVLTGPLTTTQVEQIKMRVTVTQRSSGAYAEGIAVFEGTGSQQHWRIEASVRGNENFQPGPATAVAVAVTTLHGHATDAHQWLVPISLQK